MMEANNEDKHILNREDSETAHNNILILLNVSQFKRVNRDAPEIDYT